MSLTQKRSADEVDDGGSNAAAADRPSKKARMIEENGVMRRETLKEKMRRERKEKKERKKLEKTDRKKKKRESQEAQKGGAAGEEEDGEAEAGEKQPAAEEQAEAERKRQEKREKKDKKNNNKRDKGDKKKAKPQDKTEETPAKEKAAKASSSSTASSADIEAFLKKEQVLITDPKDSGLQPILAFSQLPATPFTAKKPFAAFSQPTPIQAASWPFSLAGRDVVGIAETGSGKTMAFAVPCIEALREAPKPAAVEAAALPNRSRLNNKWDAKGNVAQALAVIVSPTRELAMQTHAALAPLAASIGLTAVCLFGGASKDEQRVQLRQPGGVDIIVATPGRLKDFINDGAVSLAHARFAVLDEADRMLDTGFEDDIRFILGGCPDRTQRQTLMFTATWPTSVRGLADGFMTDPVKISIGGRGAHDDNGEDGEGGGRSGGHAQLQANARITQTVEVIDQRAKERRVLAIIKQEQRGKAKDDRILVFCLYKKEAVRVENFLQGQGVRVCSIHGDLRQEQRTRSLEAFKSGTTPVLVATDVAARGLDIPEVKLVINVTFPLTIEDYVHRIGRTGRAGKEGRAITFFTELDKSHSGSLINVLRGAGQEVPEDLLKFGTTVKKKAHSTYGSFFKDVDMSQKGKKITFD